MSATAPAFTAPPPIQLQHEELRCLFEHGLDIPYSLIENILALPKESLLVDLAGIIDHGREHAAHYCHRLTPAYRSTFMIHALMILGDIDDDRSLDLVFEILGLPSDVEYGYLGDLGTEDGWEPVAKLATGRMDRITRFIMDPQVGVYMKLAASDAVSHLPVLDPAHGPEVRLWFERMLRTFGDEEYDLERDRATLLGGLICDVIDLRYKDLLPLVEDLYHREMVDEGYCGDLEEVRPMMLNGPPYPRNKTVLSIRDRYRDLASWVESATASHNELQAARDLGLFDPKPQTQPIVRADPKIGRNDPCPCASGKKYKKCCL